MQGWDHQKPCVFKIKHQKSITNIYQKDGTPSFYPDMEPKNILTLNQISTLSATKLNQRFVYKKISKEEIDIDNDDSN